MLKLSGSATVDPLDRFVESVSRLYPVERELGRGGVAVVYRARDLRHDRPVALKVLRPDVSADLGAERFLREIAIAAGLSHSHIVPVFDSGEAGGLLYYVMPVLEGETLRERLRHDRQLPVTDAVRITREVAKALDYAHRRGVVHRDVKPENILLQDGHAVVADFGLARALSAAGATDRLTHRGVTMGTPAYMSPEQASGDVDIDGRSDLYSLGCVLFEMLTGEPPFTGPTTLAVITRRFAALPTPVVQLRPEVPIGISRAASRLLALEPGDRYQTGAELIQTLDDPAGEVRWTLEKSVAVMPFVNMSADADAEYFSDGITDDIINALGRCKSLRVSPRTSSFAFKGRNQDLRSVAQQLRVATVLEGSVRKVGDRVRVTAQLIDAGDGFHLWSARYDRNLDDIFSIQDEIAQAIAERLAATFAEPGPPAATPSARRLEAYDLYLQGRYHWNQRGAGLRTGLDFFIRAVAADPTLATAHAGLADAYSLLSFYGFMSPHEAAPAAREAARRAIALDPSIAEAHSASGWISMTFDWDWERAGAAFERAVQLNPAYIPARLWLAAFQGFVRRDLELAVQTVKRVVELDPLAVHPRIHMSALLIVSRRFPEAVRVLEDALTLDSHAFLAYRYLSVALRHLGRPHDALAAAEREARVAQRHPWSVADLASCYAAVGDRTRAQQCFQELLDGRSHRYVQPTSIVAAACGMDKADDALAWLATAVRERDPAVFVYCWPDFDPIREDPRFRSLVDDAGLRVSGDRS